MDLERWLYTIPLRLRSLFRRPRVEQELDEELRYHLDERIQEHVDRGMSATHARREALREIGGGVDQAKERCRDERRVRFIETLLQDVRYGWRGLRRNPGFTAIAALTLAIGLGANTVIFSLVSSILLAPLPYRDPERLVSITGTYPKGASVAMREQVRTMDVAAYSDGHDVNLTGHGEPIRQTSAFVSAELFSVLGASPQLGRTFAPGEDVVGRDALVILSHGLWQQRFAGAPSIVGRSIEIDGVPREVIGVMPPDFRFPSTSTQLWIPLRNDPRAIVHYWADDFMPVVGRLRPDATLPAARADIKLFQSQVLKLFPWPMPADWNQDVSVVPLQRDMVAGVRMRLLLLQGAVALVLLIACANVANLTLARASTRHREIAIRAALGAGRRRIVRQLLTESVLLAALGAALGLGLATQGLALLKSTLPLQTPRLGEVQIDWAVWAMTAALTLATGMIFGLAPALQSSRTTLTAALKAGGRGPAVPVSQRLRSSLVIAQVALAVLLVIGAGLLIRSVWALSHINPGFHSDHIVTTRLTPNAPFCAEAPRCLAFYRDVVQQVQAVPGLDGVALVNALPLDGRVAKRSVDLEGYRMGVSDTSPLFSLSTVTPDYFRLMGITLLTGRAFTEADVSGHSLVALIDAATAQRFWEGQSAIGKHIRFAGNTDWHTIVGIVGNVQAYNLQRRVPDWMAGTMYVPYNATATLEDGRLPAAMTLAVRTSADEASVATLVKRIVANVNRDVPVSDVKTMETVIADTVSAPASTATLFSLFAAVALVLGMIGIYGVLSFLVSKRTQEIGLRLALGAQRRDVLWLVVQEAAKLAGTGILLGLASAFAFTRVLAGELYGVSALDPLTYVTVAIVMATVTLGACCIPTLRSMRVDPVIALRHD